MLDPVAIDDTQKRHEPTSVTPGGIVYFAVCKTRAPALPGNRVFGLCGPRRPGRLRRGRGLAGALALELLEGGAQLAPHRVQHIIARTEHLRAHAVRYDSKTPVGIQALEKSMNANGEIRLERVEADFDADVHEKHAPILLAVEERAPRLIADGAAGDFKPLKNLLR